MKPRYHKNMNRTAPMTTFCLDAYDPPRAMASPTSRVSWRPAMYTWRPRGCGVVLGRQTAPHVAGRAWRCELSQVGRSYYFSVRWAQRRAIGLGGGRVKTSLRALCSTQGWTGQSTLETGVRLKLHCGLLLRPTQVAVVSWTMIRSRARNSRPD